MLSHCFNKLDHYLADLIAYWHYNLFPLSDYPAFGDNTRLIAFLDTIDDEQLKAYQQSPALLYPLLKSIIPELLNLDDDLFTINQSDIAVDSDVPFWLKKGIKGRKWTQINAFSAHITGVFPVLEWCAGKGHLGRLIHYKSKAAVCAVEWNQNLCQQGEKLSSELHIPQQFFNANVLLGEGDHLLQKQQHAVALHACGDLHVHLIKHAKAARTEKVSISPCCYHLTVNEVYQPVSLQVQQSSSLLSAVSLSKQDLKLAVAKLSTSGERQAELNDQEVWWRLSFDCLQKAVLKTDQYLNVPSFPKTLLSDDFSQFAAWVIAHKGLKMSLPDDLSDYLAQGRLRFNRLRRAELVSQFFRRPLELWLVYDRALSLQEAGYQVTLSTFCDNSTTPRNILIQASLS